MKGIEIAKQYYDTYGAPMITQQFPQFESLIAVGLVGSGSECFGYDDEISKDHDFEPGFCLFIPDESVIDSQTAFALERAYDKLPKEFMGLRKLTAQPVGGRRHGVIRLSDFLLEKTGTPDGVLSVWDWIHVPEYALAEAVNGALFRDDAGIFTDIRRQLNQMPEDIRKKKLAGHLLLMAQSGQYNYNRSLLHGETGAAQLALHEFTIHAIHVIFLLNRAYTPFYKWQFRAMRDLSVLDDCAPMFEDLISQPNDARVATAKKTYIEEIARKISQTLVDQHLIVSNGNELESHAYQINHSITDGLLRNEHILLGIQ